MYELYPEYKKEILASYRLEGMTLKGDTLKMAQEFVERDELLARNSTRISNQTYEKQ